jgi:hypothetical protein
MDVWMEVDGCVESNDIVGHSAGSMVGMSSVGKQCELLKSLEILSTKKISDSEKSLNSYSFQNIKRIFSNVVTVSIQPQVQPKSLK